jgi:ribulose-bisphosphate carboxylase large chain
MSPQTETKASVGFKAGVKEYKLTYYTPEYETKFLSLTTQSLISGSPFVGGEDGIPFQ